MAEVGLVGFSGINLFSPFPLPLPLFIVSGAGFGVGSFPLSFFSVGRSGSNKIYCWLLVAG